MSETNKQGASRLDKLQFFEGREIRSVWVEDEEEWHFSIVDVVAVLTESADARNYWKVLKHRLKEEGSQLVTECNQLKMQSAKDGKHYRTDAGTTAAKATSRIGSANACSPSA